MLYVFCSLMALALLAADQAFKYWITTNLPLGETMPLLPGFIQLHTVHNYGAAWSSFSGQRWLLIGVTAVIMIAIVVVLARKIVRHPMGVIGCSLVLSGGVGNIIDRLRLGYVVDMLDFQFMNYPVFNVADICVVCGAITAMVYYLWLYEKYDKRQEIAHGEETPLDDN